MEGCLPFGVGVSELRRCCRFAQGLTLFVLRPAASCTTVCKESMHDTQKTHVRCNDQGCQCVGERQVGADGVPVSQYGWNQARKTLVDASQRAAALANSV